MRNRFSRRLLVPMVSVAVAAGLVVAVALSALGVSKLSRRDKARLDSLSMLWRQSDDLAARFKSRVDSQRMQISRDYGMSLADQYSAYKRLYKETHLFTLSCALEFSGRMVDIARVMGDKARLVEAKSCYGYSLARGGFFIEAMDTLATISVGDGAGVPDSVLAAYYINYGRVCHDLAAYDNSPEFSAKHRASGNGYLRKAMTHASDSSTVHYLKGKILLAQNRNREALVEYRKALSLCGPADSERRSMYLSTLAMLEGWLGNSRESLGYYMEAMNNDLVGCIMETNSPGNLAELLFDKFGDTNYSSLCLNVAMRCASFYGSRYRINLMGAYMPFILYQKQQLLESRRNILFVSSLLLSLLAVVLVFLLLANRRKSRLLETSGRQLREANDFLGTANQKLDEATRVKNKYLGHYMDKGSELVNQINDFALLAEQKLRLRQLKSLQELISNFQKSHDKKTERADFDATFISVFPTFVEEFNRLMTPAGVQECACGNTLTPILRIYALVRLGIDDSYKIAKVLSYTYNTVYNYRMRTRGKAKSPDTFEEDVMRLGI